MFKKVCDARLIISKIQRQGGGAAAAIWAVHDVFRDKVLAARIAHESYSAAEIGKALAVLQLDPGRGIMENDPY